MRLTSSPSLICSVVVVSALLTGFIANDKRSETIASDILVDSSTVEKTTDVKTVVERFKEPSDDVPSFQKHVSPLLGRLGCNGRACHGSFQGQGGFRLSLFGFDFESDHESLADGRIDTDDVAESLILTKPTDADIHEGGLRYEHGSWQYNLLKQWIAGGADSGKQELRLNRLEVQPAEIVTNGSLAPINLKVHAYWEDGTKEDVTALCRFQSNDPSVAKVNADGLVTSGRSGDTHVVVFYDNAVVPVSVIRPFAGSNKVQNATDPKTEIDRLIVEKLNKLNIQQSADVDDATFLRRVSLDITGTLPSPKEIRQFLKNDDPEKRSRKIDELLETPAYAAWWATFFCDLTENNTQQLGQVSRNNTAASEQWYRWIEKRVRENVPYDEMVRDIVLAKSRHEGESLTEYCERMSESFRNGGTDFAEFETLPYYWMRKDFQQSEARAIGFAHNFMGIRIQCAQCHKHPFDQWTQHDFQQFSRFFSGVSTVRPQQSRKGAENEELAKIYEQLGINPRNTKGGKLQKALAEAVKQGKTIPFAELETHAPTQKRKPGDKKNKNKKRQRFFTDAILLGSDAVDLTDFEDVRKPLMKWLNEKDNPYFARAIVNRVWAKYFGIGIVEPADDLNLANPPSNAPLLNYLENSFIESGYDLKWLHREIANSATYQLSWEPNDSNKEDRRNFSHALPRRLPAEVVFDAVSQAAASTQVNSRFRQDVVSRAISVPGTNYRQKRNSKGASSAFALKVFGRSERESSCDCDRSDETSLTQTVYLQNDSDIHQIIGGKAGWIGAIRNEQQNTMLSEREQKQLVQLENRLSRMRNNRKRLLKQGDEDRANRLKEKIVKLQTQLHPLRQRGKEKVDRDSPSLDPTKLVTEAYLRTLSRFPSSDELDRCISHIRDHDDVIAGLTGVMWALVNTKEFVVNH